jgi:hypothetical protein
MAKKARQVPMLQGSLADIDKWFFKPLMVYKPPQSSINEWYEFLFDFANRDIVRYVAQKEFVLPGILYLAPLMKVQGLGYRKVSAGTELYVRKDARHPDIIDVEVHSGQGNKEQVFCLTASEWGWTELSCQEAERGADKA